MSDNGVLIAKHLAPGEYLEFIWGKPIITTMSEDPIHDESVDIIDEEEEIFTEEDIEDEDDVATEDEGIVEET